MKIEFYPTGHFQFGIALWPGKAYGGIKAWAKPILVLFFACWCVDINFAK